MRGNRLTVTCALLLAAGLFARSALTQVQKNPPPGGVPNRVKATVGKATPLGAASRLQFTFQEAEYAIGVQRSPDAATTSSREKLLIVLYTVRNDSGKDQWVSHKDIRLSAIDTHGRAHEEVGESRVQGTLEPAATILKPGLSIKAYSAIRMPGVGEVRMLLVERLRDLGPVLEYDLEGRIRALPAPVADPADPTGSTARTDVPARIGEVYADSTCDFQVERIDRSFEALYQGRAPGKGEVYVTLLLILENRMARSMPISRGNFMYCKLEDSSGLSHAPIDLLGVTGIPAKGGTLEPGRGAMLYLLYRIPEKLQPRSLRFGMRPPTGHLPRLYAFEFKTAAENLAPKGLPSGGIPTGGMTKRASLKKDLTSPGVYDPGPGMLRTAPKDEPVIAGRGPDVGGPMRRTPAETAPAGSTGPESPASQDPAAKESGKDTDETVYAASPQDRYIDVSKLTIEKTQQKKRDQPYVIVFRFRGRIGASDNPANVFVFDDQMGFIAPGAWAKQGESRTVPRKLGLSSFPQVKPFEIYGTVMVVIEHDATGARGRRQVASLINQHLLDRWTRLMSRRNSLSFTDMSRKNVLAQTDHLKTVYDVMIKGLRKGVKDSMGKIPGLNSDEYMDVLPMFWMNVPGLSVKTISDTVAIGTGALSPGGLAARGLVSPGSIDLATVTSPKSGIGWGVFAPTVEAPAADGSTTPYYVWSVQNR